MILVNRDFFTYAFIKALKKAISKQIKDIRHLKIEIEIINNNEEKFIIDLMGVENWDSRIEVQDASLHREMYLLKD